MGAPSREVLNDCKEDLKDFVSTRLQMLRGEMKDKLASLKLALPALLIGAILLLAAFFLFTWGLVSLIAMAMIGQPYAYTVAFFVVFALYALAGGATVAYGVRTLTAQGAHARTHLARAERRPNLAAIGGENTAMTNPLPAEVLEQHAAEQRRRLHNSVSELRSTVRERLDVERAARENFWPVASAVSLAMLLLGYGMARFFSSD